MAVPKRPSGDKTLTYAWFIFLVAISFNAYDAYLRVTPSVTGEQLNAALGVDARTLGHMMTYYFVPFVLLQIPVGLLIDRLGARWLLAGAVAVSALGSCLFGAANSVGMALGARLLMGIGGAFPGVGPIYLASRWFPPRFLGLLAGLTGTATVIGSIGGEAILAALLDVVDWRTASYVASGMGLLIAILLLAVVRDRAAPATAPSTNRTTEPKDVWRRLRKVVTSSQNWINGIWGSLTLMPMLAFASLWADPFLATLYGIDAAAAATAVAAMFVGLAIGAPVAGMLSERVASRRLPMMLCAAVACLDSLIVLYVPGLPFISMYPLLGLLGFCLGSQASLVFAVALEINDPKASGLAIGFAQGVSNLGGAVFPPFIGFLLTYTAGGGGTTPGGPMSYTVGDFQLALAVIPIALASAVLAAALLRESYGAKGRIEHN